MECLHVGEGLYQNIYLSKMERRITLSLSRPVTCLALGGHCTLMQIVQILRHKLTHFLKWTWKSYLHAVI